MKFLIRVASVLAVMLLSVALLVPSAPAAPINWAPSYTAAQATAKASRKPILVDFYTDWCGWCKRLDRDVYPAAPVTQAAQKWVSVRVNAEKEGIALARRYHVTSFPTILFLDGDGHVLNRLDGYLPAPQFAEQMQTALAQLPLRAQFTAKFNASPTDADAAARYTVLCARQRDLAGASRGLARVRKLDPTGARGILGPCSNNVALLHREQGDMASALPLFKTSVKVSRRANDLGLAYTGLADCYLSQQNKSAAVATLQAMQRDPKLDTQGHTMAQNMLARLR